MIPEVITAVKYIGMIGGGSLLTLFLSKWLGKKKEEVELALDWQKFYNEHIETIKKIHEDEIEAIKQMHKQQMEEIKTAFKKEIQILKNDMETFTDLIEDIKESHKNELLVLEDKCKKQEKYINGLEMTIKEYEK